MPMTDLHSGGVARVRFPHFVPRERRPVEAPSAPPGAGRPGRGGIPGTGGNLPRVLSAGLSDEVDSIGPCACHTIPGTPAPAASGRAVAHAVPRIGPDHG